MFLRVEWAKSYMKQDMKYVIFTDETRATLDGPDGWVGFEGKLHHRFRRHQGGGGVMLWAGIVHDELVGPKMVCEELKSILQIIALFSMKCLFLGFKTRLWIVVKSLFLCKTMHHHTQPEPQKSILLLLGLKTRN